MSKNNIEGMMLELTELLAGYGEGERLIEPISEAVKKAILRKTAYSLPDRPSAAGMTPEQIKAAFYKPITDGALSVLAEADRIAEETDNNMVRFVGILSVFKGVIEALEEAQGHHGEELDAHGMGIQENSEQLEKLSRELTAAIAKCLKNEGVQVLDGSLTISGDIFVGGEAKAKQLESLLIEDACIVANAEGVPLAELSGYVIRVTESEAYAIVYDPFDECVKIGLGVYDGDAKVFTFNEGEAQALATRGDIKGGNIPVWNDEKKRFEDSGVSARAVSDLPSVESVAGALCGSASGTAVALKDVSKIEHSLAVRVSSKNLIPYPFNNLSTNLEGTTITDNGDGTITLSGKPTKNASFALMRNVMIPKGTYYYSNIPIEITSTNIYSFFQTSKGAQVRDRNVIELKEDDVCSVIIVITTAWDGSPVTIKPQLEKGTSATAHTPYIADTEAVKIKAQGKNLINIDADMVSAYANIERLDYKTFKISKSVGASYFPRANIYLGKYKDYKGKNITASIKRIGKTGTGANSADILYLCNGVFEKAEKADFPYIKTATISSVDANSSANSFSITVPNDLEHEDLYIRIYTQSASNEGEYSIYTDFQVEIGESATGYEPYIEPIEYERGEVIKSIYPSTTLTTDTPGAIIEVDYNRDINKAFAELQQAIISLGGNV